MRFLIYLLLTVTVFSCRNEGQLGKETKSNKEKKVQKSDERVLSEVLVPDYSEWSKTEMQIEEFVPDSFNGQTAIVLARLDEGKSAYMAINNIQIYYGSTYKVSVVVKKSDIGKDFAMRIQGVYPNRVDAVFDLEEGIAKEPLVSGEEDFAENTNVKIENLGNGWYQCSLYTDLYVENMRVVFGPTNGNLNAGLWETRTGRKNNVYLVPSSLKISEL